MSHEVPNQNYLDALQDGNVEPIVLVEIYPKEALTDWEVGTGDAYTNSWVDDYNSDLYPGGLYREPVNVYEDGVALTERSNVVGVINNAGSWYYEPSLENIHVHTTDSSDPDTKEIIHVEFAIRVATKGVVVGGYFYEPLLDSSSEIVIEQSTEDFLIGSIKQTGSGTIKLLNGSGIFDITSASWEWNRSDVKVLLGAPGLTYGDYQPLGMFEIDTFVPGFELVEVEVRDYQRLTHSLINPNKYTLTDYPNMEASKEGTAIPILFGSLVDVPVTLVDSTAQKGKFMIADPSLMTLAEISSVKVDGVAVDSGDLTLDEADCSFIIKSSYSGTTPSASSVTCDVSGPDASGPATAYRTSGDYYKYYGEITGWIYDNILNLGETAIVAEDALASDLREAVPQAVYVGSATPVHDVIRGFEAGVFGRTIISGEHVSPRVLFPVSSSSVDDSQSLRDEDIVAFRPQPLSQNIFSEAQILYNQNYSNSSFKVTTSVDTYTRSFKLKNRNIIRSISTNIKTGADAQSFAQRLLFLFRNSDREIEIEQSGLRLMHLNLLDDVKLTTTRAPDVTGAYTDKTFQIKSIKKTIAPTPKVTMLLARFESLQSIGFWAADDALDYDEEPGNKEAIGYWTDDNGSISPVGTIDPARTTSVFY